MAETFEIRTVVISNSVSKALDLFEGLSLEEKISHSLEEALLNRLRECNDEISLLETKYGVSFTDFEKTWAEEKVPKSHSHEVEGDYMDWEALEMEKKKVLNALIEIRKLKKS